MNRLQSALDERLYTGGCQIEVMKICFNCGDDVYDDGIEIDGDYYCRKCFRRRVAVIYKDMARTLSRYVGNRLDEVALREALEEFKDDYTND